MEIEKPAFGKHHILVSDKTSMDAKISEPKVKVKQDIYKDSKYLSPNIY